MERRAIVMLTDSSLIRKSWGTEIKGKGGGASGVREADQQGKWRGTVQGVAGSVATAQVGLWQDEQAATKRAVTEATVTLVFALIQHGVHAAS